MGTMLWAYLLIVRPVSGQGYQGMNKLLKTWMFIKNTALYNKFEVSKTWSFFTGVPGPVTPPTFLGQVPTTLSW